MARWVHRQWSPTVQIDPLQSLELTALGVDPQRATRELPVVDSAGVVHYGHLAIAALLTADRRWLRHAAGRALRAPALSPAAAAAYRVVAANRHRLPGGTAACELATGRPVAPTPETLPAQRGPKARHTARKRVFASGSPMVTRTPSSA
jgi:predicted DCC family thiol-disulfide oxidoreductase YuxK